MFGLSLPKILFTALVIAVVWFGFRKLGRGRDKTSASPEASDTLRCPQCGAYIAEETAESCGREGCSFP